MSTLDMSDGTTLFYEDRGHGRPILFVHGWGTSGMVWEGQVVGLSARARCVTIDCRGCGRSDHPPTGNGIARNAEDVLDVLGQLDMDETLLVGSSLGGNIVLEAALRDSSRLAGLVLIDSPQHFFADGVDKQAFWAWHGSMRSGRAQLFYKMVEPWFGPKAAEGDRHWTAEQLLRSGWFIDDLLADSAEHDPRDRLGGLGIPVRILHGRHDGEVPLSIPETAVELMPDAQLVVLEECGHMPHIEDPARVVSELDEFLDDLENGNQEPDIKQVPANL